MYYDKSNSIGGWTGLILGVWITLMCSASCIAFLIAIGIYVWGWVG